MHKQEFVGYFYTPNGFKDWSQNLNPQVFEILMVPPLVLGGVAIPSLDTLTLVVPLLSPAIPSPDILWEIMSG